MTSGLYFRSSSLKYSRTRSPNAAHASSVSFAPPMSGKVDIPETSPSPSLNFSPAKFFTTFPPSYRLVLNRPPIMQNITNPFASPPESSTPAPYASSAAPHASAPLEIDVSHPVACFTARSMSVLAIVPLAPSPLSPSTRVTNPGSDIPIAPVHSICSTNRFTAAATPLAVAASSFVLAPARRNVPSLALTGAARMSSADAVTYTPRISSASASLASARGRAPPPRRRDVAASTRRVFVARRRATPRADAAAPTRDARAASDEDAAAIARRRRARASE